MRRRPRLLLAELALLGLAIAAAGCGGTSNDIVASSTNGLATVRTGVLSLGILIRPEGGAGRHPFGFQLRGPFSLAGSAPRARMTYRQIANGHVGTATVVLGPSSGYVEADGQRRPLTAAQLSSYRTAAESAAGGGGLPLREWVKSQHEQPCGTNVCVTGALDPAKALTGLLDLEGSLGKPVQTSDALVRAVRSARYQLVASKGANELRRLSMAIAFRLPVPANLRPSLGASVGATIDFQFGLAKPNADVGLR